MFYLFNVIPPLTSLNVCARMIEQQCTAILFYHDAGCSSPPFNQQNKYNNTFARAEEWRCYSLVWISTLNLEIGKHVCYEFQHVLLMTECYNYVKALFLTKLRFPKGHLFVEGTHY